MLLCVFISYPRKPVWNGSPISHGPFSVENTAVGPLRTQRRLLALDDGNMIGTAQRSLPWSKALAVRHTELALASLRKPENAVTSPTTVGKEAERRCVH